MTIEIVESCWKFRHGADQLPSTSPTYLRRECGGGVAVRGYADGNLDRRLD